jgi:glycosyltransferase involved in cell wall biosynthesis
VSVRDPGALAEAIEKLASDPARRRRMGNAGREHMLANFQRRQVLERLIAFYADIESELGRKAAPA